MKANAAIAVLAAALWPTAARAWLGAALDEAALVQRADAVAVVDVVSTRAAWDERHERIVSTVELAVVESWKGTAAAGTRMTVVQPGGTVGDIAMVVFGLPPFSPGERALVFLQGAPGGAHVVGMAQGKRPVRRDLATGRWMVHAPDRARPLDDVRAAVRGLIAAGGAK